MSSIEAADREINEMILAGKGLEAMKKHYAETVEMSENFEPPCVGLAANLERELKFFAMVEQFHGATLHAAAVGDDTSFSEWSFDATYKGGGRSTMREVAVRRWKDGKVQGERFYYKPQM